MSSFCLFCFFFQAEDGIRDLTVTGVQTCALPIFPGRSSGSSSGRIAMTSGRLSGFIVPPMIPDPEQNSKILGGRRDGHVEDAEIDVPDNPAWKSFKFKLTSVESMDEAAWESFQKKQLQP